MSVSRLKDVPWNIISIFCSILYFLKVQNKLGQFQTWRVKLIGLSWWLFITSLACDSTKRPSVGLFWTPEPHRRSPCDHMISCQSLLSVTLSLSLSLSLSLRGKGFGGILFCLGAIHNFVKTSVSTCF